MSRQDKATAERFTNILRDLVKKPENKVCADCKKNDPRWASWNIGVFLCIRCSGIHRGMGTHISKVKSVDLDRWTPEQLESVQKWGNHLANLYWEAHLKPGHIPPDHKMASFIRSKYESRRWARDGPPPTDPSVLENGAELPIERPQRQTQAASAPPITSRATHLSSPSISGRTPITTRQPQAHQLLSTNYTMQRQPSTATSAVSPPISAAATQAPPTQPKAPENDLFSLDFHAPASSFSSGPDDNKVPPAPKQDVRQEILSLFSSPSPIPMTGFGQFGSMDPSPWGNMQSQQQQQPTTMIGNSGIGAWGTSSGWTAPPQTNLWGNPAHSVVMQQPDLFNTTNLWSGSAPVTTPTHDLSGMVGSGRDSASQTQKDDAFGDLWGGFK